MKLRLHKLALKLQVNGDELYRLSGTFSRGSIRGLRRNNLRYDRPKKKGICMLLFVLIISFAI